MALAIGQIVNPIEERTTAKALNPPTTWMIHAASFGLFSTH